MTDSASLKIDRAAKHVRELSELFRKKRPFAFVVKTDTKTGQRSVLTKKYEAVINEAALICGDVVHNLRSALDHVYWEIISPHCTSDKERRKVQFPLTSKADELRKTLHDAYAQRAGTGFYCAMLGLRTHEELGGNEMLSLLREANNLDKHRLLVPSADYTKVTGEQWKAEFPHSPITFAGAGGAIGISSTTFNWVDRSVPRDQLGVLTPPALNIFEREINLPVEIILQIGQLSRTYPMISTLNQMVDAVRQTVGLMREGATSY